MVGKKKAPAKKRVYRRSRQSSSIYSLTNRGPTVLPDIYTTKMCLSHLESLDQAGGFLLTGKVYMPNKIFNSTPSGTRQPQGFDQLALLYGAYLVTHIHAESKWINVANGQAECTAIWSNSSTLETNADTVRERPYSKNVMLTVPAAGGSIKTTRTSMSTKKMAGLRTLSTVDGDWVGGSTSATTPKKGIFYHIYMKNLDPAASTQVEVESKFTFTVKWFGRIPLLGSN